MNEYLARVLEIGADEHGKLPPRYGGQGVDFEREMELIRARRRLVMEYAWAVPSDAALDAIAARAPIVEVGAGGGYWAMLLRERGVDVLAYDKSPGAVSSHSEPDWPGVRHVWSEVLEGGPEQAAAHAERTLLLCWPPYALPMAFETLTQYLDAGGKTLAYIGEHYGCNATDEFFELLEQRLVEQETVGIPMFPGMHDYLTIYGVR